MVEPCIFTCVFGCSFVGQRKFIGHIFWGNAVCVMQGLLERKGGSHFKAVKLCYQNQKFIGDWCMTSDLHLLVRLLISLKSVFSVGMILLGLEWERGLGVTSLSQVADNTKCWSLSLFLSTLIFLPLTNILLLNTFFVVTKNFSFHYDIPEIELVPDTLWKACKCYSEPAAFSPFICYYYLLGSETILLCYLIY